MATRIFRGQIEAGRLCLVDREDFARLKESLEGKPFKLTLEELRPRRSLKANGYYRGVVLPVFAEHIGCDTRYLHEILKLRFLCIDPDAKVPVTRSTAELDTREMYEYVEHIRQLAAEMGCYIPDPNEVAI